MVKKADLGSKRLISLAPLLSFFASFVLEIPIVQQIMRWDMTILRESPWYQTILQEGVIKGEQKGEFELIKRLLKKRFGQVKLSIEERIKNLSREQLELLGESLFDFNSFEDVTNWLDNLN